ncbi:MAG: glycerol-3-phosphate responsive antiterminator [Firmicutes bacterium]|nr:glycerol-3-phosphate responsive antiterminator [Bacillota bacterium]
MAKIHEALLENPVIGAVRDWDGLRQALSSPVTTIFILDATLVDLPDRVAACRERGKLPFVHLDMVAGLSKDQAAIDYLAAAVRPAGIITTKPALIKPAKEAGFLTVERIFLVDSLSVQTGTKMVLAHRPDFVELMPGTMPGVIDTFRREVEPIPVIAGGMIVRKEQIIELMRAGVTAVSTSRAELWWA